MQDSKIFDKKYADCLPQIRNLNLSEKAEILGIRQPDHVFVFDFFNRSLAFDGHDFIDIQGYTVTDAVKVVLCNYILKCPEKELKTSDRLVTFREFSNAGPLFFRFTENTGKIISTTFAGQTAKLRSRCNELGGTISETASYDVSVRFCALPRVSITLNFNDVDDVMPATAGFLFHDDAETWLDLESLTIICTYLTGILIQAG